MSQGFHEVLGEVRDYYRRRFHEAVSEALRDGDVATEVPLCDQTGEVVTEGVLNAGVRVDLVVYQNDTPVRSINIDTEKGLAFPGLQVRAGDVTISFGAMKWNQMRFACEGSIGERLLLEQLSSWYQKWFQEAAGEDGEDALCVHFISDPVFRDGGFCFTVDFGTAEAESLTTLLELLVRAGVTQVIMGDPPDTAGT